MANTTIQIKKSSTPAAVPSSLEYGELAINYEEGKLYFRAANDNIYQLNTTTDPDSFGTVNANGTLLVSDISNDILGIFPGDFIEISADVGNDSLTITANVKGVYDTANAANFMPVGNTMSNGYFTVRSTANKLNFLPGSGITIKVDQDSTLNTSNITVSANLTVKSANIVNITVSATEPTNNVAGDIWIDIS